VARKSKDHDTDVWAKDSGYVINSREMERKVQDVGWHFRPATDHKQMDEPAWCVQIPTVFQCE
jgi:hypothetical protein